MSHSGREKPFYELPSFQFRAKQNDTCLACLWLSRTPFAASPARKFLPFASRKKMQNLLVPKKMELGARDTKCSRVSAGPGTMGRLPLAPRAPVFKAH
jgi:hypothetical protein